MGAISPCQVTGRRLLGLYEPPWTLYGLYQKGICRSGFPFGGSPPSAQQLSGLKNEMGREIHKLLVLKTCLLGELLIDWKAPPQSALKLNGEGGCWGVVDPKPIPLPRTTAWALWQSSSPVRGEG